MTEYKIIYSLKDKFQIARDTLGSIYDYGYDCKDPKEYEWLKEILDILDRENES